MKDLYLITGFLGAGKTTFLTEIAKSFANEKIAIIVNEFGSVGVDSDVLKTHGIESYEITNGSIFCVCRKDLFMDALNMANKLDVSTLIVETSGLSDPLTSDEIMSLMLEIYQVQFNFKGIINLIDAKNFHKVLKTAVCVENQVISADLFVINKCDLATDLSQVKKQLIMLNSEAEILETTYGNIDFEHIKNLTHTKKENGTLKKDITLQKKLFEFDGKISKEMLDKWLAGFKDNAYRIKGFVTLEEGNFNIEVVMGDVVYAQTNYQSDKSFVVVLYNSKLLNYKTIPDIMNMQ